VVDITLIQFLELLDHLLWLCCVTVRHMCDGPYSAHPSRHMSHHLIRCDRCDGGLATGYGRGGR
jgi:hypothetical protein